MTSWSYAAQSWTILGVLVSVALLFYLYRAYVIYRRSIVTSVPPIWKLVVSGVLIVVTAVGYATPQAPLWLHLIRITTLPAALILSYSANCWLLTNQPHHIQHDAACRLIALLVLVAVVLGILTRDNLGLITTTEEFEPTLTYYAHYGVVVATLVIPCVLLVQVVWRSLGQSHDLTYRLRRQVTLLTFIGALVSMLIVAANLVLSMIYGDTYRPMLNRVHQRIIPLLGIMPLINAMPQVLLKPVVLPLQRYHCVRERRKQALLHILHEHMIAIVPHVQLPDVPGNPVRMEIEIGDARDVIWSYLNQARPLTPAEEAAHLLRLRSEHQVLSQPGPFQPPLMAPGTIHTHNLEVARRLQRAIYK